ncbi:DMT family transporter [Pseudogracilibacillus auburnensis]|uniref:DMT family transporter n=1 Tax=Pseudogracilibacillus auburnensis TaxID=1494959 RepID=UPI001A95F702|nr:DMT family transporter [Pseudogracilibacillus auburnensis]MBO1004274.1 DMT family transporter [Pseudogracilibacillus auburnensis]
MKNNILIGAILCLIASASWGAMFPVANHAFQYIDPFYFTIIRYLPVTVILIILLLMTEGKKAFKPEGKGFILWFFGTMGFTIYNLFIFWGQNLLGDAGVLLASIMEALAPIISVLIVWLIHKNRPYLFTIICIIGAFIGVFLVVTNGSIQALVGPGRVIPLLILFLAAAGWAVYTIGGGVFSSWSVLRYSTLSCLYGTLTATLVVVMVSLFGFIEVPTLQEVYMVRYNMLFMIFLPGLFALLFWNKGVTMLKPINAILFINFAPVTTIIIRLIQGYSISFFEFTGVFIVCLMIILNNLYQRMMMNRESKLLRETRQTA